MNGRGMRHPSTTGQLPQAQRRGPTDRDRLDRGIQDRPTQIAVVVGHSAILPPTRWRAGRIGGPLVGDPHKNAARGTFRTMTVARGTFATFPPSKRVARGTFATLNVARGTFATHRT